MGLIKRLNNRRFEIVKTSIPDEGIDTHIIEDYSNPRQVFDYDNDEDIEVTYLNMSRINKRYISSKYDKDFKRQGYRL